MYGVGRVSTMIYMKRSEENLMEWVFHICFGDWTREIRPTRQELYHWAIWSTPAFSKILTHCFTKISLTFKKNHWNNFWSMCQGVTLSIFRNNYALLVLFCTATSQKKLPITVVWCTQLTLNTEVLCWEEEKLESKFPKVIFLALPGWLPRKEKF